MAFTQPYNQPTKNSFSLKSKRRKTRSSEDKLDKEPLLPIARLQQRETETIHPFGLAPMTTLPHLTEEQEQSTGIPGHPLRTILRATLSTDENARWEALKDHRRIEIVLPTMAEVEREVGVPPESRIAETIVSSKKEERLRKEAEAQRLYAERLRELNRLSVEHEQKRQAYNDSIDQLRRDYEEGNPEAVKRYFSLVLKQATPHGQYRKDHSIHYDPTTNIVKITIKQAHHARTPLISAFDRSPQTKEGEPMQLPGWIQASRREYVGTRSAFARYGSAARAWIQERRSWFWARGDSATSV